MTSLSALSAAADAAPESKSLIPVYFLYFSNPIYTGISSLIVDSLLLRGMTRVAFALAEDQYKLLEAKLGTLSLILSRVYSDEGDAGLRRYFHDVEALQSLLEFSRHVPLDTPMLYPRRTSTSTMGITKSAYTWTTTFDEEEVDEYLSSLRRDLRQKSTPSGERSSEVAEGSNPPVKPAEVTPPPAPGRGGSLFGSPREPSPLVPKKRRRVVIAPSESSSAEQASGAGSEVQTPPPTSPPARRRRLPSPPPPPQSTSNPLNPLIGVSSRYPSPPANLSSKEQRQWRKLIKRAEVPRKKRRTD